MEKTIFISLDWNCISDKQIKYDALGGTERLMLTLDRWLIEAGYKTHPLMFPILEEYDLAIFSNTHRQDVPALKEIIFAGSWHTDAGKYPYDEVVNVSELMKEYTKTGIVIPACFTNDVLKFKGIGRPYRIVCNANPNKYLDHMYKVLEILDDRGIDYEFHFCGGHKLYSDNFPLGFDIPKDNPKIVYHGILDRWHMLELLSTAHIFAFPNFSSDAETFGVSPIEAMALGKPTILPNRRPYTDVHKGAIFCNNEYKFADMIDQCFDMTTVNYDVSEYTEESVKKQWLETIERII